MSSSTQRPLLSIVIPTRERARYLRHSLNTAAACADPRIEIVVSDNASEDDTAKIVAETRCANLRYVRTKERVPVSQNFESAFSNSTGEYVLYIGDDDAVIPSGIRVLLELLETRTPDIVFWPQTAYYWPDSGRNGFLRIKRRHLMGGIREFDPAMVMQEVCAGRWLPESAPQCQCVSRKIMQAIAARAGQCYFDIVPDTSGFAAMACAKSYIYLNRPVTVYGRSPASATSAISKLDPKTYAAFAAENFGTGGDMLDVRCRSTVAVGLAGLLLTRRIFGLTNPPVDFEMWKERIVAELAPVPEPNRIDQLRYINEWLVRNRIAPIDPSLLAGAKPGRPSEFSAKKSSPKISLHSIVMQPGPDFMQNVESAVRVAEHIAGSHASVSRSSWPVSMLRWIGAMLRARRLTANGSEPIGGVIAGSAAGGL